MDISSYFPTSRDAQKRPGMYQERREGDLKSDGGLKRDDGPARSTRWSSARSLGVDPRALYSNKRYDGDEELVYKPRKSQRRMQKEQQEEEVLEEDDVILSSELSEATIKNIMDTILNVVSDVFEKFLKRNGLRHPTVTPLEEEKEIYYERSPSETKERSPSFDTKRALKASMDTMEAEDATTRPEDATTRPEDATTRPEDATTRPEGTPTNGGDAHKVEITEPTGTPKEGGKHRIVYMSSEVDELYAHCLDLGIESEKMTKEALKNRLSYALMRYILMLSDYYYKNLENLNNLLELVRSRNDPLISLLEKIVEIYRHVIVLHLEKLRERIPVNVKRAGVLDFRAWRYPESHNLSVERLQEVLEEFGYGHFVKMEELMKQDTMVKREDGMSSHHNDHPSDHNDHSIETHSGHNEHHTAHYGMDENGEPKDASEGKEPHRETTSGDSTDTSQPIVQDDAPQNGQQRETPTSVPPEPHSGTPPARPKEAPNVARKVAHTNSLKIPKKSKTLVTLAGVKNEEKLQTKHFGYRPKFNDTDSLSSMSSIDD